MSRAYRRGSLDSIKLSHDLRHLSERLEENRQLLENEDNERRVPIHLQKRGNKDYLHSFDHIVQHLDEPRDRSSSFGQAENVNSLRRKVQNLSIDHKHLPHGSGKFKGFHNIGNNKSSKENSVDGINSDGISSPPVPNHDRRRGSLTSATLNQQGNHTSRLSQMDGSNNSLHSSKGSIESPSKSREESPSRETASEEIQMKLKRLKKELEKRKPQSTTELRASKMTTAMKVEGLHQVEREIIVDMMDKDHDKYFKELESCRYLRHQIKAAKEPTIQDLFSKNEKKSD